VFIDHILETTHLRSRFICVTSPFGFEPRRMVRIIKHFGRHCGCHLQVECAVFWAFLKTVCGAGSRLLPWIAPRSPSPVITCSLPCIRFPKAPSLYTYTRKMATEMSAETLRNSRHLMRPFPERRSYTLNSSRENLRTGIILYVVF
jgi:hypothetical protein